MWKEKYLYELGRMSHGESDWLTPEILELFTDYQEFFTEDEGDAYVIDDILHLSARQVLCLIETLREQKIIIYKK